MIRAAHIQLKRAYDPPAAGDGRRILVDRLWPRGLRKDGAQIDEWRRDLAPSTALRKWFAHDTARWVRFCTRYAQELRVQSAALRALRHLAQQQRVTLLYAAHDAAHNNAVVLRRVILGRL
jgi:uncharacterized protein YeaO (DUF488 family)